MLTHRNMTNTAWAISTYLGNMPEDVVLTVLPLAFDYGLYQVITGSRVGFTVVLEKSFANSFEVINRMAEYGVTGLPGVPTIFARLLQIEGFNSGHLKTLRYLSNTAAALPPAHIVRLQQLFPQARIFSMYGLTGLSKQTRVHSRFDETVLRRFQPAHRRRRAVGTLPDSDCSPAAGSSQPETGARDRATATALNLSHHSRSGQGLNRDGEGRHHRIGRANPALRQAWTATEFSGIFPQIGLIQLRDTRASDRETVGP
jgi:acyl-CoA synthetase (AMP-forming)/AMP-acid ligase II